MNYAVYVHTQASEVYKDTDVYGARCSCGEGVERYSEERRDKWVAAHLARHLREGGDTAPTTPTAHVLTRMPVYPGSESEKVSVYCSCKEAVVATSEAHAERWSKTHLEANGGN